MASGTVQCSLNAVGECAHDYTALPGDTVKFELRLDNGTSEDCEYQVAVQPPVVLPAGAVSEPAYGYFNIEEETTLEDDCIVVPCGGCLWITWEVEIPEDFCGTFAMCARLYKKSDDVETVVIKNLKTGTAQVDIAVKPEMKDLVSQVIRVGLRAEDLKSCPDSNGRRSNDGTAISQWIEGAFDDCTAAAMMDACESGFSFIEFIKACLAGEPIDPAALPPLSFTLTKDDTAESIQGVDIDGDGDIGVIDVTIADRKTLQARAKELDVSAGGTNEEIAERIVEAQVEAAV